MYLLCKTISNDITSPLHDSTRSLILIQIRIVILNGGLNDNQMIVHSVVIIRTVDSSRVGTECLEMAGNECFTILLCKLEIVDLVDTMHGVEMEPSIVTHVQITTVIYWLT